MSLAEDEIVQDYIFEMKSRGWNLDEINLNSSEDVKSAYYEMKDEYAAEIDDDSSNEDRLSYSL